MRSKPVMYFSCENFRSGNVVFFLNPMTKTPSWIVLRDESTRATSSCVCQLRTPRRLVFQDSTFGCIRWMRRTQYSIGALSCGHGTRHRTQYPKKDSLKNFSD